MGFNDRVIDDSRWAASLATQGFPVDGKPTTKPKIVSAARDLLQAANNDVSNRFVGDD